MVEARTRKIISASVAEWRSRPDVEALVLHGRDVDELWADFAAGYVFVQAAGGCVTDEHQRLLAIERLGVWDLPKGKVDDGEAVDAAALREVREECGLKRVDLLRRLCGTWHTYERGGRHYLKRTDWYLMRASSAEPLTAQAEEAITAVRWMDAGAVRAMKASTYPSLRKVIAAWEEAMRA